MRYCNCRPDALLQVLTPADDIHHINKHNFKVPFVCGCRDLGEALRRIAEGAAMIRTKGEAGTGNVVEAVRHTRSVTGAIRQLQTLDDDELYVYAKEIRAPVDLVRKTKHLGRQECRLVMILRAAAAAGSCNLLVYSRCLHQHTLHIVSVCPYMCGIVCSDLGQIIL